MEEFHVQWHITSRCDLRCIHCYQDNFSKEGELGWHDLKLVCDNLLQAMERQNRRLTIALTGGEPFLKEEIWDIVDYLCSSPYVLNIGVITNGIIIDRHISKILNYPLLGDIYVSLDGISQQTDDSIRGKDAFKKAVENIKLLKSYNLSVFLMFTLMKRNIKEAEGLLDFSKSLAVDGFILERFIPLGQGKKAKEELIIPEQLNELYREIFRQCGLDYSEKEGARYHALKVDLKGEERGAPDLYGAECIVGKDGCALLPDGTVLPCRRFFYPLGNLLKESLSDIWVNSPVLNKLRNRKNLEGNCRDCEIEGCQGCRALAYALTGNYLSSDSLCRLVLQK